MSTIENAKRMAKSLRTLLEARDHEVTHSVALEMVAQQLGYKDWNTASAALPHGLTGSEIKLEKAIPILRMFDEAKARSFTSIFWASVSNSSIASKRIFPST